MQRLLVGIVIGLTAAVAVLAIMLFDLRDDLRRVRKRPTAQNSRRAADERQRQRDEKIARVEGRLDASRKRAETMERELRRLREQIERVNDLAARTPVPAPEPLPPEERPIGADPTPPPATAGRARDVDGEFIVTDEEQEYFLAVQKKVERRRRIDGMTRNLMRRIDRLEQSGEIGKLEPKQRNALEKALRVYVQKGDDLVTRYVRAPDEEIRALTPEEKRNRMAEERETFSSEAQRQFESALGQATASIVSDRVLTSTWGVRRKLDRSSIPPRRSG